MLKESYFVNELTLFCSILPKVEWVTNELIYESSQSCFANSRHSPYPYEDKIFWFMLLKHCNHFFHLRMKSNYSIYGKQQTFPVQCMTNMLENILNIPTSIAVEYKERIVKIGALINFICTNKGELLYLKQHMRLQYK